MPVGALLLHREQLVESRRLDLGRGRHYHSASTGYRVRDSRTPASAGSKTCAGASCCRLNSKAPAPIAAATSHGVHPVAAGVVSSSLAPESKLSRKRAKPAFNSAGSKGMASDTRPATWGNESPRFTAAREGAGGGLLKLRCVPDALAAASPANKNGRFGCVNAGCRPETRTTHPYR